MAMEHNPSIRQAMFAASKAAGVRTQVGLKPNPEVGYSGQQLIDENSAGQNGPYVTQTFVTANKLNLNRAVLDRDVQSLLWEAEAQRYRVRTDLRLKFYDALAAQRRLALAREFHEVATKGVEIAEKRLNALEGAKPDVLQAEIQLSEVDLIVQRSEIEFDAAWKGLVTIVGLPHLPPAELLGTLGPVEESIDVELVYHELIAVSPQLQAARARVDRARANISRQSVQAVPNVTAQVGAGADDATGDPYLNLQLSVPLPVHNQNQGNQQAAQAELCRALQEVQRLELAVRAELVQVMQEFRVGRVSIELYENTIIPKAQETLDLSEQAYLAGEFDFLRVLTVRRTFFETNLQYVQSLASAAKAEARIEGMLLSGGLDDVPDFDGDDGLRDQALGGE
ncbi:MAG: TolC family protein [Planctomycetaceae bacterium]